MKENSQGFILFFLTTIIKPKFIINTFWLTNANGMIELQNHHFVTLNEVIVQSRILDGC